MQKIPLSTYIANNSPSTARKILSLWGVDAGRGSARELADKLSMLVSQQGQGVLIDMFNMHPDKDMILQIEEMRRNNTRSDKPTVEIKANACGCSSSCDGDGNVGGGCACSSCKRGSSGFVEDQVVYGFDTPPAVVPSKDKESKYPILLFGGIALALGYVLYKS